MKRLLVGTVVSGFLFACGSVANASGDCTDGLGNNPQYEVCSYDRVYTVKKLVLDFCGFTPLYDDIEGFRALPASEQDALIDDVLDACLDTEFWMGKNGQLWQIAHPKMRPLGAFKSGEDQGGIPLADYYDDYHLFAYSQMDGHDAREVLTAQFFVIRTPTDGVTPTTYTQVTDKPATQFVVLARRAGVLTTTWNLAYNVMFTALPRTAAAQIYRAYIGKDIARLEGLYPVADEPVDYDYKGVTAAGCAVCHSTLDPLTYPFRNYNGLTGSQPAQYVPNRLETLFPNESPIIGDTPEAGSILGQPVADLIEWASVAANSEDFAINLVTDYWQLSMGHEPTDEEFPEFTTLWKDLMTTHNYSVEAMLHDLVKTEAYGAP